MIPVISGDSAVSALQVTVHIFLNIKGQFTILSCPIYNGTPKISFRSDNDEYFVLFHLKRA